MDAEKLPVNRQVKETVETVVVGATTKITYGGGRLYGPEDFPGGKIPAWLFGGCVTDEDRAERDALLADPSKGTPVTKHD